MIPHQIYNDDVTEIRLTLSDLTESLIRQRFGEGADLSAAVEVLLAEALEADPLLSVTEAAEALGVSGSRIRALLRDGKLKGEKTSAGWGIRLSAVNARLSSH